jgi:hypothetical protein
MTSTPNSAGSRRSSTGSRQDSDRGLRSRGGDPASWQESLTVPYPEAAIPTVSPPPRNRAHRTELGRPWHMPWRRRDTITTPDSLAFSRSRYNAHEFRTSQAECRGFESRLPLQPLRRGALSRRSPAAAVRTTGRPAEVAPARAPALGPHHERLARPPAARRASGCLTRAPRRRPVRCAP